MTVLVTGATGFIGSNLVQALQKQGIPVVTLARKHADINTDLSQYSEEVEDYLDSGVWPTTVIHLAANPLVKVDNNNPNGLIHDNLISTNNIIRYVTPYKPRFIYASSVIVYGNYDWIRCQETDRCRPTSLYGITKLASENLVNMHTDNGDIRGVNLRLCATVGKGLTHGVIHDFIHKLRSDNPNFELIGDKPGSTKPFIHIDDVVTTILTLANTNHVGAFNVAPNDEVSVDQIADIVQHELDIHKPKVWLGSKANWKGDNPVIRINNQKLQSLVPLKYRASEQAIRAAVEAYL